MAADEIADDFDHLQGAFDQRFTRAGELLSWNTLHGRRRILPLIAALTGTHLGIRPQGRNGSQPPAAGRKKQKRWNAARSTAESVITRHITANLTPTFVSALTVARLTPPMRVLRRPTLIAISIAFLLVVILAAWTFATMDRRPACYRSDPGTCLVGSDGTIH
jgi:hypothetical protein